MAASLPISPQFPPPNHPLACTLFSPEHARRLGAALAFVPFFADVSSLLLDSGEDPGLGERPTLAMLAFRHATAKSSSFTGLSCQPTRRILCEGPAGPHPRGPLMLRPGDCKPEAETPR